jgi:hypothetical protein
MVRVCFFLLFFSVLFSPVVSFSQGCSDAGVCTMGTLSLVQFRFEMLPPEKVTLNKIDEQDADLAPKFKKNKGDSSGTGKTVVIPDSTPIIGKSGKNAAMDTLRKTIDSTGIDFKSSTSVRFVLRYPKVQLHTTFNYGVGDRGTTIFSPQVEGVVRLVNRKLFGSLKIPYHFISGELGNVSGVGDPIASLSYIAFRKEQTNLVFSLGGKFASNDASRKLNDSLPLPMVYQTSLGSHDLLFGFKYTWRKLDFVFGYQHAFNRNNNGYLNRPDYSGDLPYNAYFQSRRLKRNDDLVFRVNYNQKIKKASGNLGVLFIYHTGNDIIELENGSRVEVAGSAGLTINLNVALLVPLKNNWELTLVGGAPVQIRESRPDGLTRQFVFSPGIRYNLF